MSATLTRWTKRARDQKMGMTLDEIRTFMQDLADVSSEDVKVRVTTNVRTGIKQIEVTVLESGQ
jgi:hypothetical protein